MESNTESYEDILWNKYENIKKKLDDDLSSYTIAIKYFKEYLIEIDRHILNLSNIKGDSELKKFSKLNDIFHLFNLCINLNQENHKKMINNIISNFEKYISFQKKLVTVYSEFKQYMEIYSTQQKKFSKIKEKFNESASILETKTLEQVQKKNEKVSETLERTKNFKKNTIDNLKKYQSSIEEINKKREECVSKQKNLIKQFYEFGKFDINMYYDIISNFLSLEKDKVIVFLNNSKFNKLQKQLEEKNIEVETKNYFDNIKPSDKIDDRKEILFEGYKSKINFDNYSTIDEYNTYIELMDIIKKNYKDIYDENSLEKEKMKSNIREWIKKFFEFDEKSIEIDQSVIDEYYFKALKQPYTHKSFLKVVTDLRTTYNFKRNKQLIDLLGKSFKIIIDEAKNTNDFWSAKNCLILSQTFYYLDNDNKIFSCEYFKKDSWLLEKNFWIELCSYMLDEEIKKIIALFPELNLDDIHKNKTYSEKLNAKISNVIFSQLCSIINNLKYFTNNNLYAIELIETFKKKYIYLTDKNAEPLYQIISNDKNIIEELKNEYHKNNNTDNSNKINDKNESLPEKIVENNNKENLEENNNNSELIKKDENTEKTKEDEIKL